VSGYAAAAGLMILAIVITRMAWGVFWRAPFAPMFFGVYAVAHWGTRRVALFATALGAIGSIILSPSGGGPPFLLPAIAVFLAVALLIVHLVSDSNRMLAALQASEARFRATWEHAALGAAVLNDRGEVAQVNPALERLLGYSEASWSGAGFDKYMEPDDAAGGRVRFAEMMRGAEPYYHREQRFRRKDGDLLWGRSTVSPIRDANGVSSGALMVVEDVTARHQAEADLRRSEEQLRQGQKMEAVGQLVAGVAHNFNNLLTISMAYTDLLLDRHKDPVDQADLEEIRKATARAASLTRQMLLFSRRTEAKPRLVDLNEEMSVLREILTQAMRGDVRMQVDLASAPATVRVDPQQFEHAVINLVLNARDALPRGGNIRMTVCQRVLEARTRRSNQEIPAGEYVCLDVQDDGVGMAPDVVAHLFEPFFTTKEVGQGTGLGLAAVYGMVRQHDGYIDVVSAPGQGTAISLFFPSASSAFFSDSRPADLLDSSPGATILVVGAEDAARSETAATLLRRGHRVLESGTAEGAKAIFDAHGLDVDLLISDAVLPDARGTVLASQLLERQPGLLVMLLCADEDQKAGRLECENFVCLMTPLPPDRLTMTVTHLLKRSLVVDSDTRGA
jgi:PAS domain S-box-containing protein